MNRNQKLKTNEKGLVSIMVAVFLVLIVSLVVVNYSRLVRREQRQVLDRQLNTQALYMAESGVDHIQRIIEDNPSGLTSLPKTTCGDIDLAPGRNSNLTIDPDNLKITCSLIDDVLEELPYNGVGESGEIIPLYASGTAIESIKIQWRNTSGAFDVSDCDPSAFRPSSLANPVSGGCSPGLLKVDIVNSSPGPGFTETDILANTFTAYLYPDNVGSNGMAWGNAAGPTNQGFIQAVRCDDAARICSIDIDVPAATHYHMRLQSLYNVSDVVVSVNDAAGTSLGLVGAQASIDVTAKAVDVIRRIKVSVPISGYSDNELINGALRTSSDICKQYSVIPFNPANPDPDNGSVTGCGL